MADARRDALVATVVELQRALMRGQLGRQSEALIDPHLTMAQFRAVLFIHAHPERPTAEVADVIGVRPNIATGVVQRLVDRGWVARVRDSDDGRVRRLVTTDEGNAFVDSVITAAQRDFASVIEALDDAQLEQLAGILEAVAGQQPQS